MLKQANTNHSTEKGEMLFSWNADAREMQREESLFALKGELSNPILSEEILWTGAYDLAGNIQQFS